MARYVDVSISGVTVQIELQTSQVRGYDPASWMSSPQWWAKDVRATSPMLKASVPGFQSRGTYKETPGISIELFNPDGSRFAYLALAGGMAGGTAYGPRISDRQGPAMGYWKPTDKPVPHSWYGLMFKAGGGLAVGAEGQAAVMISAVNRCHGCSIGALSGRLGPVVGGSGGFAVVFATGFANSSEFSKYSADGFDWALSFGTKFSSFVKGASKLGMALRGAAAMLERLEDAARLKALKELALKPEVGAEIYGIAKSATAITLIDSDLQSITVVDIPMASVGAEIGIYYATTGYRCLSQW